MKLTKGKISKLYSKNKQSLKKYNNKRKGKNNSFRKNIHVNLKNKTLKRFIGGQPPNETGKKEDINSVPNVEEMQPVLSEKTKSEENEKNQVALEKIPEVITENVSDISPLLDEVKEGTEEPELYNKTDVNGKIETENNIASGESASKIEEIGTENNIASGETGNEESGASSEINIEDYGEKMTLLTEEQAKKQAIEQAIEQAKQGMSTTSGEGLPENVSISVKTMLDYAIGSLARQINSGTTISQITQNPESAFTNMTNTFASKG